LRRWSGGEGSRPASQVEASNINDRIFERTQVINYWNQRIEMTKARWSPKMRANFDDSMREINEAVTKSLDELNRNPHDEFSEQMLNVSLNKKLELLKDFSDL